MRKFDYGFVYWIWREKISNIYNFENLECWQQARELVIDIYKKTLQGNLSKDFGLRDQMRKSVVSIISNIAEGKERETPAELIRFLFFAKGSAGELRAQLIIAKDISYIKDNEFSMLIKKIEKLSFMIGALIRSIRQRESN